MTWSWGGQTYIDAALFVPPDGMPSLDPEAPDADGLSSGAGLFPFSPVCRSPTAGGISSFTILPRSSAGSTPNHSWIAVRILLLNNPVLSSFGIEAVRRRSFLTLLGSLPLTRVQAIQSSFAACNSSPPHMPLQVCGLGSPWFITGVSPVEFHTGLGTEGNT